MRQLNENGLKKINQYIDIEYGESFAIIEDNGKKILFGEKSEDIFNDLKSHGIIFEEIGDKKFIINVNEDTPIATVPKPTIAPVDTGKDYEEEKKIQEIVKQILPLLSKHFPTKDEINTALNELRAQLIDPEKLTEIFKNMSADLKKTQAK